MSRVIGLVIKKEQPKVEKPKAEPKKEVKKPSDNKAE